MEVVVTQALLRQTVQGRGRNRPAEGAGGAEAEIVDKDDHHVGRSGRGFDLEWCGCLGLAYIQLAVERPFRLGNRQYAAIRIRDLGAGKGCAQQWHGPDQAY
ncbi:hypothetical protein D9M68_803230 [compost metagenome]